MTRWYGGAGRFQPNDERPKRTRAQDARTLRRVAAIFRPYRWQVLLVVTAILVSSAIGLVNPILLKLIIDRAIADGDLRLLNIYVELMILAPIVGGIIGVGQTYLSTLIGQRVMRDLRLRVYTHLQGMPLRFFTDTRTGEIQSRISNDVGGVQNVVTNTASSVVSNVTTAISTVVAMLLISGRLTALSFALMPIALFLTYRLGNIRREIASNTQRTMADVSSILEETLSVSGVLLTKTFGRQQREISRFEAENEKLARLQVRQQMVGRWFFMIVGTFFSIAPALTYWLAGRDIINAGSAAPLTIGDLVAFTTLQSRLFFPLGSLLNIQVEIQGALALFDRIFEYLDKRQDIVDAPHAIALDRRAVEGRVRYEHVSFTYPTTRSRDGDDDAAEDADELSDDARATLDDIDFEALPGQLVALVGPSGAGKTTLTYLLPRLYDVDQGRITIDGRDVRDITLASLGEIIGVVTQETHLFHATVRENLLYGRPNATQEEVERAARAAAIHDRIMELDDGYDTVVGERGYRLSGGEKQRMAIARVILKDPRVLILDEATSALDSRSERLIQSALKPLMAGRTTIAIAHRLSTILAADLILVLDRGKVVERGTHLELLRRGGLYARLYAEQFGAGEVEARCADGVIAPDGRVVAAAADD